MKKILKQIWMSEVMCILFHRIHMKNKFFILDDVVSYPFVQYKCNTCGRKYLAKSKRDWYRVNWKKKFKKKKIE
jgi:hypothetical protein